MAKTATAATSPVSMSDSLPDARVAIEFSMCLFLCLFDYSTIIARNLRNVHCFVRIVWNKKGPEGPF